MHEGGDSKPILSQQTKSRLQQSNERGFTLLSEFISPNPDGDVPSADPSMEPSDIDEQMMSGNRHRDREVATVVGRQIDWIQPG